MKFILKIGLLLFLPVFLWKCDSEMMDYEGKDGVYFMMQTPPQSGWGDRERWEYVDTTRVNFASVPGSDTVLPIRVRVMGNVTDYNRQVSVRIVSQESTAKEGEDYEAFEQNPLIFAHERETEIPCRIIKTEKLLKEKLTLSLVLELQENADFVLPLPWWQPFGDIYGSRTDSINVIRHVILINNEVRIPGWWPERYWGKYSDKKLEIMCGLFHMTWDDFNQLNGGDATRAQIMGQN
ncbi:MAG: DUF4843 domain-containing protein, partial [Odoribacter sp.]|nr:DUF4843 domain-containing protein [Odoribacter sp.]